MDEDIEPVEELDLGEYVAKDSITAIPRSADIQVKSLDIRGMEVAVFVDTMWQFYSIVNGVRLTADNIDALKARLMAETKKAATRVMVPFSILQRTRQGYKVVQGVATGVHAGTDNILVDFNGRKEQFKNYGTGRTFLPLPPSAVHELLDLTSAKEAADQALTAFQKEWSLDLRNAVQAAVKEAQSSA